MIGKTLGHYHILEKIGAGGMGEVYRARDEHLGRDVAIKVLPEAFARDTERLARFEREAQLLAALNHPNIAPIYGLEEFDRIRFLVLELVPGETLAERLGRGALPGEEALGLCRQIAEGLEAAHERGIVHRDLKPGNVKVTPEGKVKILDFGLAKAFAGEAAPDLSHSPTITEAATRAGTLLGTAAYMSPEQARGKPVDKRTDIWAFGCVLYEMLTGRQPFGGETVSDAIARILEREPDWTALPAHTPPSVQLLLRRCLQKDSTRRLHDIGDARLEIEDSISGSPIPAVTIPAARRVAWQRVFPWTLAVLVASILAGIIGWSLKSTPPSGPSTVSRFVIPLLPTDRLDNLYVPALALSPEGSRVAYVANRGGTPQIYLRPIDSLESRPVPETEGASLPFFSPDGQWLGFYADGKLKKVSVTGGAPVTLVELHGFPRGTFPFGVHWASEELIVFTPGFYSGVWKVPASGGRAEPLTTVDPARGEAGHHWPHLLPGGKAVLFTVALRTADTWDDALIVAQSLQTGERKDVIRGGTFPRYVPTGHLVYVRSGRLMAVPFDAQRLELRGPSVPLVEDAMQSTLGAAQFSFSRRGDFVYLPGGAVQLQRGLAWVDRGGRSEALPLPGRPYLDPRMAPDGRRLVVRTVGVNCHLHVYDLGREAVTRLTLEEDNHSPLWTPEGNRVLFESYRAGTYNLYWIPADGSSAAEQLTEREIRPYLGSVSRDGKTLAFVQEHATTKQDIWLLPLTGDLQPRSFLHTAFNEAMPQFSPDGRWLAYVSDQSGRTEVYVQPFPGPGPRWQISTDGGTEPMWNPNGRELFYRNADRMMVVDVVMASSFNAGRPRLLFRGSYLPSRIAEVGRNPQYDITPDGRRFLMVTVSEEEITGKQINVVLNWFDELKRRVPTKQE